MHPHNKNIGAFVKCARAFANTAVTAGGTGDATLITGATIDRRDYGMPMSAVLAIPFTATLAANKKIDNDVLIEDSADGTNFDTFYNPDSVTLATDSGSGSTLTGCQNVDVDLSTARRYIRAKSTPDMNASGTDTAALSGTWVFAGQAVLPI